MAWPPARTYSRLFAVIEAHGQRDEAGRTRILFGDLFEAYATISETVRSPILGAHGPSPHHGIVVKFPLPLLPLFTPPAMPTAGR